MGGIEPTLGIVLAGPGGGQARRHGEQGTAGRARYRGVRPGAKRGRAVAFEGSVAGGIPIVQALGVALAANQVQSLAAIVNGTCNFILTSMTRDGLAVRRRIAAGPGAGLCGSRPDARRRRHRHRAQAGDPGPARLRGERADRSDSAGRDRPASTGRHPLRGRARATRSSCWHWPSCRIPGWNCGSPRPWSSKGLRWPRSGGPITRSGW